jgi:hypothetical protein
MRNVVTVVFIAAMLLVVAPVAATPPSDVEIVVETDCVPLGLCEGPFVATGPAVDAGLVCSSGWEQDLMERGYGTGSRSGRLVNLHIIKQFTCDDGSGQFTLDLQVHIDFDPFVDVGNWTILRGDQAYSKLHGRGTLVGLPPQGEYTILDIFSGKVHVD